MKKKISSCIIVFLLFPTLCGCWSIKEITNMYYAHTLGIDYKKGSYTIYVSLLYFPHLAKAESGGQQSSSSRIWIGKGKGRTVDEAIHDIYKTSDRRIYWGHMETLVFTDEALKYGVDEVVNFLARYSEIRYTLWMYSTREQPDKLLATIPILFESPVFSVLGSPNDRYEQRSYVEPKSMQEVLRENHRLSTTALLPELSISKGRWESEKQKFDALMMDSVNVLVENRWKGRISGRGLNGYRWMNENSKRMLLTGSLGKDKLFDVIFYNPKVKVDYTIKGDRIVCNVHVKTHGAILGVTSALTERGIRRKAEAMIAEEIRHTYEEGIKIKADFYSLLNGLYIKRPKEFHRLTANGRFPLTKESLNIKVTANIKTSEQLRLKGGAPLTKKSAPNESEPGSK
ncbi:Ger(x)C family spore germination protein [Aneurinibacillus sp. REN35]|uniref:Ger(x)C family spore germination protein n=1 Tax=Aneurinibacillus sp. REN35 TaxID=3237286 RepID=UPI003529579E